MDKNEYTYLIFFLYYLYYLYANANLFILHYIYYNNITKYFPNIQYKYNKRKF